MPPSGRPRAGGGLPVPTKIVRMFGGRLDGKKIRSDRRPDEGEHPGNAQLLLIDDDAPVGEPHAVYEYVSGRPVRHAYEIAAHSVTASQTPGTRGWKGKTAPAKRRGQPRSKN